MKTTMNILLLTSDPQTCCNYTEYANTLNDIAFLCITDNINFAASVSAVCSPDAIILDLPLTGTPCNGLDFLQKLSTYSIIRKPYILITTEYSDIKIHDSVRKLGADFIFSKHQKDYCEVNIIHFLHLIQSTCQDSDYFSGNIQQNIRAQIYQELDSFGISPKAIGYDYLAESILLLIQGNHSNICSVLADRYDKSIPSINRAMQNAIDRAWETTPRKIILHTYTADIHSKRGIPTPTEFIRFYAQKINL